MGKGIWQNQVKMKRGSKERKEWLVSQRSTVRGEITGGVWPFNFQDQLSDQVQWERTMAKKYQGKLKRHMLKFSQDIYIILVIKNLFKTMCLYQCLKMM